MASCPPYTGCLVRDELAIQFMVAVRAVQKGRTPTNVPMELIKRYIGQERIEAHARDVGCGDIVPGRTRWVFDPEGGWTRNEGCYSQMLLTGLTYGQAYGIYRERMAEVLTDCLRKWRPDAIPASPAEEED